MKGSGIDAFEFEFGSFTCSNTECNFENKSSIAYGDDWGNWEVSCEECEEVFETGTRNSEPDDDSAYDAWRDGEDNYDD